MVMIPNPLDTGLSDGLDGHNIFLARIVTASATVATVRHFIPPSCSAHVVFKCWLFPFYLGPLKALAH